MYRAAERFADLRDEEPKDDCYAIQYHVYNPGDVFPRAGMTADAERITGLLYHGYIEEIPDGKAKAAPETAQSATATSPKKAPARKRTRKAAE